MLHASLVAFASCALGVGAKQLWATEPADPDNIITTAYPVGNGKLGGKGLPFPNLPNDDGQTLTRMLSTSSWNGGTGYRGSE
jgi:alpha-L-fucosidase 2